MLKKIKIGFSKWFNGFLNVVVPIVIIALTTAPGVFACTKLSGNKIILIWLVGLFYVCVWGGFIGSIFNDKEENIKCQMADLEKEITVEQMKTAITHAQLQNLECDVNALKDFINNSIEMTLINSLKNLGNKEAK